MSAQAQRTVRQGSRAAPPVRRLELGDRNDWRRMRHALWPEESGEELERGMAEWEASADAVVFVAVRPDGSVCGFVEAGSRSYADGCETSPVGYVEGWYVDPDVRRQGYGRALLAAAEEWARAAASLHISRLLFLPMPALVVLPFRGIDVLGVDRTPRPARTRTTPGTILGLALGQLRRHLGVTRRLTLRPHISAWHLRLQRKGTPPMGAAAVP